jgi:hypothetical protein
LEGVSTYSTVLSLWNHEVEDGGLDGTPDAEDNISLPGDILESNGDTELVGQQSCLAILVNKLYLEQVKELCLPMEVKKLEKAIPLARISKERTSTGYKACIGVQPKE